MYTLRRFFGKAFTVDTTASLIGTIITYIVFGVIFGIIVKIVGHLPLLGLAAWIVGGAIELYVAGGIVLSILHYLRIV